MKFNKEYLAGSKQPKKRKKLMTQIAAFYKKNKGKKYTKGQQKWLNAKMKERDAT
ncbi:MAG: hypothetical protein Unbinned80contig1000_25 [Prokaryotic dsDNA virus sp.]|nr:MAG: hypothetical protein Unbinned80contig1000_25 [Prokaryotic dsDNA virus sp.]|tara:strand:- start:14376 stop:14540 length:165 start_codon:yes stop_codon:yes gene_type:complete